MMPDVLIRALSSAYPGGDSPCSQAPTFVHACVRVRRVPVHEAPGSHARLAPCSSLIIDALDQTSSRVRPDWPSRSPHRGWKEEGTSSLLIAPETRQSVPSSAAAHRGQPPRRARRCRSIAKNARNSPAKTAVEKPVPAT